MARPLKNGLSYFPFDVDFFSDKKIKRLRAKYGTDGIAVYLYLLCEIYRSGYYVDYDEDLILDVSDELKISENETTQIMNYLVGRSLLQLITAKSKLANPVKVLTAASVQRRYQEAKKGAKRDIEVDSEFWVLEKEETESFIKVRLVGGNSENNDNKSEKNVFKSENNYIKKSKVKESKVKESIETDKPSPQHPKPYGEYKHVKLTDEQYKKLIEDYGESVTEDYIKRVDEWCQLKGKRYKDYSIAIRNWINQDGVSQKSESFDVEKYKSLINKF